MSEMNYITGFIRSACVVFLVVSLSAADTSVTTQKTNGGGPSKSGLPVDINSIKCPVGDKYCEKDRLGFEAIRLLHEQIDDDGNGKVDLSESDDFLRDELKYEDGFERHSTFHHGDDMITFLELWKQWTSSEVYNWTVDDVIEWLVNEVELEQYVQTFRANAVGGPILPRMAVNMQFKTNILGLKNPVHKQKLSLKAMDCVLFGAPKKGHNYIKDLALVASIVVALGGCWLALVQHRSSQKHIKKVMEDLKMLQKAEDSLTEMQDKLHKVQQDKKTVIQEKIELENKLHDEIVSVKKEAEILKEARESTAEEVARLRLAEDEVSKLGLALRKSEEELQRLRHLPNLLPDLQQWLQLTYEIETRHYEAKKELAEKQLMIAKEMCEKIRKKKSAFMGSFRIAHTTSIDDTDTKILGARAALEEVGKDLQERSHRWTEIERLCGFCITNNPGLSHLSSQLRATTPLSGSQRTLNSYYSTSQVNVDDADEDVPPPPPYQQGRAGHDHHVCASLMRAGIQLTAVGFNLSGSRAVNAGLLQSGLTGGREGSHSRSTLNRAIETINEDTENRGRSGSGGPVDFYLDQTSSHSRSNLHEYGMSDMGNRQAYTKSHSLDISNTAQRPQTLLTSYSESALSSDHIKDSAKDGMVKSASNSSAVRRAVGAQITPSPLEEEENSSPESTDTGSLNSLDEHGKEKRKKIKLLPKLLRKDKTKTS